MQSRHFVYVVKSADKSLEKIPQPWQRKIVSVLKNLETDPSYAYWSFPAFRFKLSIYYKDPMADNATREEIYKMISDSVQELYDRQQTLLPLQLELTSSQAVCRPGEEIQFDVLLKNESTQALRVAGLNEESMFCLINKKKWGKENLRPKDQDKVLQPGKSLKKIFKLTAPYDSDEISVYCVYGLSFKGVKPYGQLKIKVQE